MFVLKKLFQLRDKTQGGDEEKPFLEHLEDLRVVITRVVLTLVIAMAVCFVFRNELMEIIRRPVEQVWKISQDDKMPDGPVTVDLDTWEQAKKAARDITGFTPAQREYYFAHVDQGDASHLRFHTESVLYYRAAIDIENANGTGIAFIEKFPGISEDMRKQLLALMDEEKRPDVAVDSRGKLVLMQALNPTEGFMLSIKLSLFAGIVISFPLLLLFTLQFVLPGLRKNEKRALWPAMAIGFGLFLTGVLFSYFFVLPKVLDFFYNYSQEMGVTNEWRIGYYISFATQFTLIFGLSFELPVVVMTMVKLGVLNYDLMRNTRSYAILAIVVIAAIITPTPDAFTLLLLAGPMILLYEICIWLAFFHNRKEREAELAEAEELRQKLLAAPAYAVSRDDDDHDPDDYEHPDYYPDNDPDCDPDGDDHYYHGEHFDDDGHDPYSPETHDDESGHEHDDEHAPHREDEGDEEDTGTYDFPDDELGLDYNHDAHRPDDSHEPAEEHPDQDHPVGDTPDNNLENDVENDFGDDLNEDVKKDDRNDDDPRQDGDGPVDRPS